MDVSRPPRRRFQFAVEFNIPSGTAKLAAFSQIANIQVNMPTTLANYSWAKRVRVRDFQLWFNNGGQYGGLGVLSRLYANTNLPTTEKMQIVGTSSGQQSVALQTTSETFVDWLLTDSFSSVSNGSQEQPTPWRPLYQQALPTILEIDLFMPIVNPASGTLGTTASGCLTFEFDSEAGDLDW